MRLLQSAFVLFAISGLGFASISSAATIDLTGDVGAAIAAGNSASFVYSGNEAFGDVTFSATTASSDLTHAAGNGLGIDCSGYTVACLADTQNQLDTGEILTISFERPLFVTSVDLRNLFGTNLGYGSFSIHIDEGGGVAGKDFYVGFDSNDAGADGTLKLTVRQLTSSISIVPSGDFFTAFSVAGISIGEFAGPLPPPNSNPIPEPSSVVLMLIGGALVASQLRGRL